MQTQKDGVMRSMTKRREKSGNVPRAFVSFQARLHGYCKL